MMPRRQKQPYAGSQMGCRKGLIFYEGFRSSFFSLSSITLSPNSQVDAGSLKAIKS